MFNCNANTIETYYHDDYCLGCYIYLTCFCYVYSLYVIVNRFKLY